VIYLHVGTLSPLAPGPSCFDIDAPFHECMSLFNPQDVV
jgi:hypothetical protein